MNIVASLPSFSDVAKSIIKRSIKSAICIDDQFEQPYMSSDEIRIRNQELSDRDNAPIQLNSLIPKELYRSFRVNGICDLDIYNFKNLDESWRPNYMLNNKDLLIIDWELDGKDGYKSTLEIISQAISPNDYFTIPFIIIYTAKPAADFKQIIEELLTNFNPYSDCRKNSIKEFFEKFLLAFTGCFDEVPTIDVMEDFLRDNKQVLYEYWAFIGTDKVEEAYANVCYAINSYFSIKDNKTAKTPTKLKVALENTYEDRSVGLEKLFYISIESNVRSNFLVKRIKSSGIGIKINSSVITIFSKDSTKGEGFKPEEVFDAFSDLISKDPHNFLTLLSTEMRDRLREDSYKIGESISSLDERAFFYHLGNYKERSSNYKNEFFDFLIKSWTNEIEAYNINQTPYIFSIIEEYISEKKLEKKQINAPAIINQLAELAIKLSTVTLTNRTEKDPQIRFGDIFKALLPTREYGYFLSITPQCVCVDSEKVDNNFFFIAAEHILEDVQSSLQQIETEFISLIKDESKLLALRWGNCKPFTLWIRNNNFKGLKSRYAHYDLDLKYVTTLKENFAQRMSNKAYSYGMSVGIDLPHITKK